MKCAHTKCLESLGSSTASRQNGKIEEEKYGHIHDSISRVSVGRGGDGSYTRLENPSKVKRYGRTDRHSDL